MFLRSSRSEDDVQEPVPDPPLPPEDDGERGEPESDNKKDEGKNKGEVDDEGDRKEYRAGNCNDCTRQFCLDYNLPICKKATMEDVFTTCFRMSHGCYRGGNIGADGTAERDSRKDEAVVFIFIIATVGLLVWAAAKPWITKGLHVGGLDAFATCSYTDYWVRRPLESGAATYPCRVATTEFLCTCDFKNISDLGGYLSCTLEAMALVGDIMCQVWTRAILGGIALYG